MLARAPRRRLKRVGFSGHWQARSQRASSAERGVDGGEVEAGALCEDRQPQGREVGGVAAGLALQDNGGTDRPCGRGVVTAVQAVGVGVVVEEQVEAGGGAEVEHREWGGSRMGGRDVAERRQQRRAPSDLVGLGGPGGHEPFEFFPLASAEVGEVGCHVRARRLERDAAHTGHRVVVGGQGVLCPAQEEIVHRGEQDERTALGQGCVVKDGQHLVVLRHVTADGRIDGAPVTLGQGGEGAEVVGQRLVDEHAGPQKLAGRSGLTAPKKA